MSAHVTATKRCVLFRKHQQRGSMNLSFSSLCFHTLLNKMYSTLAYLDWLLFQMYSVYTSGVSDCIPAEQHLRSNFQSFRDSLCHPLTTPHEKRCICQNVGLMKTSASSRFSEVCVYKQTKVVWKANFPEKLDTFTFLEDWRDFWEIPVSGEFCADCWPNLLITFRDILHFVLYLLT